MTPLSAALLCAAATFCVYLFKRCAQILWRSLRSPLHSLPGPKSDSFIFGNLQSIFKGEFMEMHEKWMREYGETHMFYSLFNAPMLFIMDHRAINHILTHTTEFQKAKEARRVLGHIIGQGVLVAEDDQHKRQRRIMNPAFGPLQVRELTSIFLDKSLELRDAWVSQLATAGATEPIRIDALSWLGRATLDIIGLAGFNYGFDAIQGKESTNELSVAFNVVFEATTKPGMFHLLQSLFTPLRLIRTKRDRHSDGAQAVMRRIGLQLIADKKAAIHAEKNRSEKQSNGTKGRDLLTLLIKANMAVDVSEMQRMTDEEVLGQISTFIVAGHETTSTATTWCLFALTQAPEVQRKLRQEILNVETDTPTMDELAALPYLDMVVRETLRLHAPVPGTDRAAMTDTYIPLSKPFTDKYGKTHDSIRVGKGDPILIPILFLHQSKELWGDDALQFRPERWENPPEAITSIPGIWSNILTFLGGPHSCIGYRFAIVEMKALIFTLVRAFEFELAVPAADVTKRNMIVTRPLVPSGKDGKEKVNQMPLLVRLYRRT